MMLQLSVVYTSVILSGALLAQQPAPVPVKKAPPTPRATQPAVPAKPQVLTVANVVSLLKAGLSEAVILSRLRKADKAFDLSPDEMITLKNAGASDQILTVMMDPKAELKPVTEAPAPPAAPAPLSPLSPAPITVGSQALTATPGTTTNDSNDPNSRHEPGIYLSVKEGDRQVLKALSLARAQGMHHRGMALHSLTSGITKAKTNRSIPGERSEVRTTEELPVFYFFLQEKRGGFSSGGGLFNNPNEFLLQKLTVRKGFRELTIHEVGKTIVGDPSKSGEDMSTNRGFSTATLRAGVFKVTPRTPLTPGEYVFTATFMNFDFGVDPPKAEGGNP